MAILNNNPLVGASGNQGGYNINNSLRFRSSATAYLSRTPSSSGNRQKWTWSGWVKRGALSDTMLFHCQISSTDKVQCRIDSNHNIAFLVRIGNVSGLLITSRVLRDPSAWYHIMFVCDTTQATATTQFKIYVNGVEETSFSSSSATTQNGNSAVNSTTSHQIGYDVPNASSAFDGYLAETYLIDGQALTPSSFGETDTTTGVWKPKAYSGTYGTNGFYLKFSDIATTSGSNAGLGKDFSGNSNYWTTNNISVTSGTTYDAMTDVPTNTSATVANYCTLNPLNKNTNVTVSNANLTSTSAISNAGISGTMYVKSSGKYYWEATCTTKTTYPIVGIVNEAWSSGTNALTYPGATSGSYGYANDGLKYNNGSTASYGASYTSGDIIGVALDLDAGTLTFYKNNTSQGTAYTGLTDSYAPSVSGQASDVWNMNFGQRPFSYTPPTGFVALNTYNLPTPTILQGNKYMDATLWTGNGPASQVIVNQAQFKPDMVWVKNRNSTRKHNIYDSVRGVAVGASYRLVPNLTSAEDNPSYGVTSMNSNGFTIGEEGDVNANSATFVGWQWQAGQGSTSSNTSGSITSTVSVNTTAGFSIVTYTGTGANATVGHGLGVAPKMIVTFVRNTAGLNHVTYHASLGNTQSVWLNLTNAATTDGAWNNTTPTSTVFSVAGSSANVNGNGYTIVAYCWAAIPGFSAFGSYTGNASTDGPFVYTGFRPKFIMYKITSAAGGWVMLDTSRTTYNVTDKYLLANASDAEGTFNSIDILSNGFKVRNSDASNNPNGGTVVYMAFAESPFSSNNRAR